MWNVDLNPELKRKLKDPKLFADGLINVYLGLAVAMCGVVMMLFFFFQRPDEVLIPTALILIGFGIVGRGEWQKFRAR